MSAQCDMKNSGGINCVIRWRNVENTIRGNFGMFFPCFIHESIQDQIDVILKQERGCLTTLKNDLMVPLLCTVDILSHS